MNKNKLSLVLLVLLLVPAFALTAQTADKTLEVLGKIYFEAVTEDDRLNVLRKIVTTKAAGLGAFCQQALTELEARRIETGTPQDLATRKALGLLLIPNLAQPADAKTQTLLRSLFSSLKDAQLRGAAALAMARSGDAAALPVLLQALGNLNQSELKTREEENLAWHVVSALALLKSPEAFETVFATANSWYSPRSQVKTAANAALPKLTADLGASYIGLISGSREFTQRIQALAALEAGTFAADVKLSGALAGLKASLAQTEPDADIKRLTANFRKKCLTLASGLKAKNPETATVVASLLLQQPDREEARLAARLLGNDASDAATDSLAAQLREINARQKMSANSSDDLAQARELIAALGRTKNPRGKTALAEVEFCDYTPGMIREANLALSALSTEMPSP